MSELFKSALQRVLENGFLREHTDLLPLMLCFRKDDWLRLFQNVVVHEEFNTKPDVGDIFIRPAFQQAKMRFDFRHEYLGLSFKSRKQLMRLGEFFHRASFTYVVGLDIILSMPNLEHLIIDAFEESHDSIHWSCPWRQYLQEGDKLPFLNLGPFNKLKTLELCTPVEGFKLPLDLEVLKFSSPERFPMQRISLDQGRLQCLHTLTLVEVGLQGNFTLPRSVQHLRLHDVANCPEDLDLSSFQNLCTVSLRIETEPRKSYRTKLPAQVTHVQVLHEFDNSSIISGSICVSFRHCVNLKVVGLYQIKNIIYPTAMEMPQLACREEWYYSWEAGSARWRCILGEWYENNYMWHHGMIPGPCKDKDNTDEFNPSDFDLV